AGGAFTSAGGLGTTHIARWDGAAWNFLAPKGSNGINGNVWSMTAYGNDLIAAGGFNTAGGVTCYDIARWDGSAWMPLASGWPPGLGNSSSEQARAVAVHAGQFFAGGNFTTAGGQPANRIARWQDCGDVNADGSVTVDDLLAVINVWGPCSIPTACPEDFNGDAQVNVDDLLIVISNWG